MDWCFIFVQVFNECPDTTLVFKNVFPVVPFIGEVNMNAWIQERQFSQPFGQYIVVKFNIAKNFPARIKSQFGPGLIGVFNSFSISQGNTHRVLLEIQFAVALDA